jgi:hypothetical protein
MRIFNAILWCLVVAVVIALANLLAQAQEIQHELPVGVTFKDGTYYVKRSALKQFQAITNQGV